MIEAAPDKVDERGADRLAFDTECTAPTCEGPLIRCSEIVCFIGRLAVVNDRETSLTTLSGCPESIHSS
jgi:hypothetical protein